MKVTVLQENIARGLGIVSRAVSPRSTLPVLANIMIATDEGRLRLSATNLEMAGSQPASRTRARPPCQRAHLPTWSTRCPAIRSP